MVVPNPSGLSPSPPSSQQPPQQPPQAQNRGPASTPVALHLSSGSAHHSYPQDASSSELEVADSDDMDSLDFESEGYEMELSSIVMRHEYENGRRFHQFRHGRYPLPNDDPEQERDALKHTLLLELTEGRLIHAPLGQNGNREPQRIIDLGCGTGRWTIDAGEAFPAAEVIGIDLSPIMPEWLPPNVRFIVDDIEDEEWLHGSSFDLVYIRHVMALIRSPDIVLKNSFNNITPGGWIECTEFDGFLLCNDDTMPDDHPPKVFLERVAQSLGSVGINFNIGARLEPLLEKAGFVNIEKRTYPVAIGRWAKTPHQRYLGMYMIEVLAQLFESAKSRALPKLGLSQQELDDMTEVAIANLDDIRCHAYINVEVYTGQKPF
ncbi:putative methyltransferase domain-containing protein [Ceratocystis lukuohia]|uniref:Methyltransferase domain-containing protein n=1 Tax=Ceratocystis lukuohia TaxID=2019550 RepID=A0ABR4MQE6_9PEZI